VSDCARRVGRVALLLLEAGNILGGILRGKWKALVLVAGIALVAAACDNVVSTPAAPSSWSFLNEGTNGSGFYVNGPGTPPAGRGSALLTIDSTGREGIVSGSYSGIGLSALDTLSYSTYQIGAGATGGSANLEFDVDYDSTDSSTAYQGRLVYVPESSGTPVVPNTWQTWNTMTGNAAWYSSAGGSSQYRPIVGDNRVEPLCTQTSFCTWQDVTADYGHARIRPKLNNVPAAFMIRVGGNGHTGSVAVDNLTVGGGGQTQLTDFEPGDGHIAVNNSTAAGLGFGFQQDSGTSGSGAFVSGPSGADGSGTAQLTLNASSDGETLGTGVYAGTRFSNLTFLSYKTFEKTGVNAATLQFDGDFDSTDADTSFQGRVVFEPRSSGATIRNGIWQTWNPLTAATGWWTSHGSVTVGGAPHTSMCILSAPCSFQQLLTEYPKLAIRGITGQDTGKPVGGGIYLKAGSSWTPLPFVGNVDSLTIGVKSGDNNGTVTYDFEG
jgi:hypothetical protein